MQTVKSVLDCQYSCRLSRQLQPVNTVADSQKSSRLLKTVPDCQDNCRQLQTIADMFFLSVQLDSHLIPKGWRQDHVMNLRQRHGKNSDTVLESAA